MPVRFRKLLSAALAATVLAALAPAAATAEPAPDSVRFATFNASLNRSAEGQLVRDLSSPGNAQADAVAEIIQRTRPEVLLINEFDYDAAGDGARLFQENYLSRAHGDAEAISYAYRYVAPSNTGVASGFDLDNNGRVGGPNDAYGFGFYPGQFGMAVYSQHPIDTAGIRTFQRFLWKDMPGALLPDDPSTAAPADWYSPGGARRLPALLQESLGRAGRGRRQGRPPPCKPPDAAGVRRARGSQWHAQPRRDPLLGRLHHAQPLGLHLR